MEQIANKWHQNAKTKLPLHRGLSRRRCTSRSKRVNAMCILNRMLTSNYKTTQKTTTVEHSKENKYWSTFQTQAISCRLLLLTTATSISKSLEGSSTMDRGFPESSSLSMLPPERK